ncbi:MAG: alpha/beta hydrolase-fold protein [Rikenellaceae bacterium]
MKLTTLLSIFVVACAALVCSCGSSQDAFISYPSPLKASYGELTRLELHSVSMADTMSVDIWTPEGFPKAGVQYNVVYMNDGQMLFDREQAWNKQAWVADSTAQKLIGSGEVQPYIIVGVHNFAPTRTADYFPEGVAQYLSDSARSVTLERIANPLRADKYLAFIVNELKPYIEAFYPVNTSSDATVIMGSSMGGLISLYAICEYPEVFGGAACMSTHLAGWGEELPFLDTLTTFPAALCDYMSENLPLTKGLKNKIYFDYGDQTLDGYYLDGQAKVDSAMLKAGYEGELWQTLFFEGDGHDEISWAKRLNIPVKFLFAK